MIVNIQLNIYDPKEFYDATMDEELDHDPTPDDIDSAVRSALWQMSEYGGRIVSVDPVTDLSAALQSVWDQRAHDEKLPDGQEENA